MITVYKVKHISILKTKFQGWMIKTDVRIWIFNQVLKLFKEYSL